MFSPLEHGLDSHARFNRFWRRGGHHLRVLASRAITRGSARWLFGAGAVAASAAASVPAGPADDPDGKKKLRYRDPEFGHEKRRMTDTFLVLNCICFMLQWLSRDMLTLWGAKINSCILEGQWWRLLTPAFLHKGLFHLFINSYALNSLGPQLEALSGPKRFLSIYLLSAVTGNVVSVAMSPKVSIGSSGAIFGLAAALGLFYWRHKEPLGKLSDNMLQQLGVSVVINVVYSLAVKNIDNWGHLGGLLGGALVAWLLGPSMKKNDHTGRWVDSPPVRWLAYPENTVFGGAGSSTAKLQAPPEAGTRSPEDAPIRRDIPKLGRRPRKPKPESKEDE